MGLNQQTDKVASLLLANGTVSAHDLAYRHGITRAAARIYDLKQRGWKIETIRGAIHEDGTRDMATYRLIRAGDQKVDEPVELTLW